MSCITSSVQNTTISDPNYTNLFTVNNIRLRSGSPPPSDTAYKNYINSMTALQYYVYGYYFAKHTTVPSSVTIQNTLITDTNYTNLFTVNNIRLRSGSPPPSNTAYKNYINSMTALQYYVYGYNYGCPSPSTIPSVNCVVSAWSDTSACDTSGYLNQTRTITTQPSGNGQACPSLTQVGSTPCGSPVPSLVNGTYIDIVTGDYTLVVDNSGTMTYNWFLSQNRGGSNSAVFFIRPSASGGFYYNYKSGNDFFPNLGTSGTATFSSTNIIANGVNFKIQLVSAISNSLKSIGVLVNGDSRISIDSNGILTYNWNTINPLDINHYVLSNDTGSTFSYDFNDLGGTVTGQNVLGYTGSATYTNKSITINGTTWSSLTNIDCVVSAWSDDPTCDTSGYLNQTRTITTQPSGNGQACPSLTQVGRTPCGTSLQSPSINNGNLDTNNTLPAASMTNIVTITPATNPGFSSIPNWTFTGYAGISNGWGSILPHSGNAFLWLQSYHNTPSTAQTTITGLRPGHNYTITLYASCWTGDSRNAAIISINNQTTFEIPRPAYLSESTWTPLTYQFTATSSSAPLVFSLSVQNNAAYFIDSLTVTEAGSTSPGSTSKSTSSGTGSPSINNGNLDNGNNLPAASMTNIVTIRPATNPGFNSIPNWTFTGYAGISNGWIHILPHSGNAFLWLQSYGSTTSTAQTTITGLTPGNNYIITLYAAYRADTYNGGQASISINGQSNNLVISILTDNIWQPLTYPFVATSSTAPLIFSITSSDSTFFIDSLTVTEVSASIALMASQAIASLQASSLPTLNACQNGGDDVCSQGPGYYTTNCVTPYGINQVGSYRNNCEGGD